MAIGAGGSTTGVVFNPTQPGLAHTRDEIGGLYRRDTSTGPWIPLLDRTTYNDWNRLGVESVATGPQHSNVVRAAVGTYPRSWAGNGAIPRSGDHGTTWTRIDTDARNRGHTGRSITGDPRQYGRVHLATDGGGTQTVQPRRSNAEPAPASWRYRT